MKVEEMTELCALAGIQFEDPPIDGDRIVIEKFDQGYGERGFYYLYNPYGNLKGLQVSTTIVVPKVNRRPAMIKMPEIEEEPLPLDDRIKNFLERKNNG